MQLRWGIVGTGRICQDFCLALLTCDPKEHSIVAVGSRSKSQAEDFSREFQLDAQVQIYGSQDEVFQDANVDIVYIGTIEQVHRNLCIKALNHQKHVLCEKPLAMNTSEIEEIIAAAKKTKNFIMEGIWSRFFPIYNYLRDAVQRIGKVNLFGFIFKLILLFYLNILGYFRGMHFQCSKSEFRRNLEHINGNWLLSNSSCIDCI